MCRFLLNDLVRYYRTICVDFEYKTHDGKKSWGDRNIKLMFSRKLLYFSGLLVIAETVQHTRNTKISKVLLYLNMTPIERVISICGQKSEKSLLLYDKFLEKLSKDEVRKILCNTEQERDDQSDEFRVFKNEAHHFTWELSRLLTEVYDSAHPIHLAIKF